MKVTAAPTGSPPDMARHSSQVRFSRVCALAVGIAAAGALTGRTFSGANGTGSEAADPSSAPATSIVQRTDLRCST